VTDTPVLIPGYRQLELELYRWTEGFDLNDEVDRGRFMQRMLECWRIEGFRRLHDAAKVLDIEITPRTLHDELIKKIVGRWIQVLLKHNEKPRLALGDAVIYRNASSGFIPVNAAGYKTVVIQKGLGDRDGEVFVRGSYEAWVQADDLLKF
jgi:hypothetical protein